MASLLLSSHLETNMYLDRARFDLDNKKLKKQ